MSKINNDQKRSIRLLSLGLSQSNFITQLYGDIINRTNRYKFDVNNYYNLSDIQSGKKSVFDNLFHFEKSKTSILNILKEGIILFFSKKMIKELIIRCYLDGKQNFFRTIYSYIREYIIVKKHILPLKHDIYQFHFCVPEYTRYAQFLPDKANIICSFWGSDLLRISGLYNTYYISNILNKAKKITVQSLPLKEIILSKYGRHLYDKIEIIKFTISLDIYNNIQSCTTNSRLSFCKNLNIQSEKTLITVGYNAKAENNHIKILKELDTIKTNILNNIIVLIPLAYGIKEAYIKKMKALVSTLGYQVVFIEDFLDEEKVAALRYSTDIQIQMPVSDALSGSVTEVLYAGNIVLAGSWLPYEPFETAKIRFHKIGDFKKLKEKVEFLVQNKKVEFDKNLNNKKCIEESFFPDTTSSNWIDIYDRITK